MNEIRYFKFWCQKVLPLVYDDSLSYYELLCKVVDYINKIIGNLNELTDEVDNNYNDLNDKIVKLTTLFNQLKSYVDNYFENLDVQDEIDKKLDEMAQDGTLEEILAAYIGVSVNNNFAPSGKLFGGQLSNLYSDILNPLKQDIQINLIGDSITWGSGASNPNPAGGRTGRPSDPRNFYDSPCWANLFKRYIKSFLIEPVTETLSNYPTSPSGESVVTYESNVGMSFYPQNWEVKKPTSGGTIVMGTTAVLNNFGLGVRFSYNGSFVGDNEISINGFTGDKFSLRYLTNTGETLGSYAVYVNDNMAAVFNHTGTAEAIETIIDSVILPQKVWNAKITIKPYNYDSSVNGYNVRITSLIIPKKIRIDNCGIIGTTLGNANVNITNNGLIQNKGNYNFIALGTNNRLIGSNALTNGSWTDGLYYNATTLFNTLKGYTDGNNNIVIGLTPPKIDAPTSPYTWNAQTVNNMWLKFCKDNELDFVNMYEIFYGIDNDTFTSDGLHPNDYGYNIMFNNIRHMMSL